MTDKETEIKAIAGTIFDLRQAYANMGMMNDNQPYEQRKKSFEVYAWINYQITEEENKLRKVTNE